MSRLNLPSTDWSQVIRTALDSQIHLAGNYNLNTEVNIGTSTVIVRRRMDNVDEVDLRLLKEVDVLRKVEDKVPAPKVLFQTDNILVISKVGDITLSEVAPGGVAIPTAEIQSLVDSMISISSINYDSLLDTQRISLKQLGLEKQDCFYAILVSHLVQIVNAINSIHPNLTEQLHLVPTLLLQEKLLNTPPRNRPPSLIHADIHRHNIRRSYNTHTLHIIDWEMAMIGDPLYELAIHLHKMRYTSQNEIEFMRRWYSKTSTNLLHRVREDLQLYRNMEIIKSSYIDALRVLQTISTNPSNTTIIPKYYTKLEKSLELLDQYPITYEEVESIFRSTGLLTTHPPITHIFPEVPKH